MNAGAREPLELIAEQGPLARRILRALGGRYEHAALREIYAHLCDCLAADMLFEA